MGEPARAAMRFGDLLRQHRLAAGLSQDALAERAGLSRRGLSDLERGARNRPYPDTIDRVAAALGLSAAQMNRLSLAAGRRARSASRLRVFPTPETGQDAAAQRGGPADSTHVGVCLRQRVVEETSRQAARGVERPTWEREEVIAAGSTLLSRARTGTGGVLLVVADAGLGKTTVLNHLCRLATPAMTVGVGRGNPAETSLPFGLMTQVLGGLGARDLLLDTRPFENRSASESRTVQFHLVLRWLEDSVRSGPRLLALDDLHWADSDSLALISFICRRIATLPVAVIGMLRSWPRPAREMVRSLAREQLADVRQLLPLSELAAIALLSSRSAQPLVADVGRHAWQLCAGNPLLLEHVAAAMTPGGSPGTPLLSRTADFAQQLLLQNFADLPAPALRFAKVGSVLGTQFRPDIAAKVAQMAEGDVDLVLEVLAQSGLVRDAPDGRVEFVHPLLHQTLYRDLGAGALSRLHARAFAALAQRGLESEAAEHAKRAHLVGNRDAVRILERVGRTALRTGALAAAATHLESAVALAGDRVTPQLLLECGEAILAGGRPAEAIPIYERVLAAEATPPAATIAASRMLGRALFAIGIPDRSTAQFEAAAALASKHQPAVAADVVLDHALGAWVTLGPAGSLPLAIRARMLSASADAPTRRRAQAAFALIALQAGDPSGLVESAVAAQEVAADPLTSLNDLCWTWSVLHAHGVAAMYAERFTEAASVLGIALAAAERIGATEAVAGLAVTEATRLTRTGRLTEALAHAARATSLAHLVPFVEASAAVARADVLLQLGRGAESETWCARAERAARTTHQSMPLIWIAKVRAQRLVRAGRLDEACELYAQIEVGTHQLGIGDPCIFPWARSAIAAYLAAGRTDDAQRVIDWLQRCALRLPCRWPRMVIAVASAVLPERRGSLDVAEQQYRAALALGDEVELPLERRRTLSEYDSFLRRSDRAGSARPILAEAPRAAQQIPAISNVGWIRGSSGLGTCAGGEDRRPNLSGCSNVNV